MPRSRRAGHPGLAAGVVVLLVAGVVGVMLVRAGTHSPSPPASPVFGVLQADPTWLSADTAAGIRLAMVNVYWDDWEPQEGDFDKKYAGQVAHTVSRYRDAGWEVAIDIGLQTPPQWVLHLPAGTLQDQNGKVSGGADFEFSENVRQAAARYITTVVGALGSVQYYRVGLSEHGEAKYPDVTNDGWWAFEPTAQGSQRGLPPGVGVTPMPGWVPGTATYKDKPVEAKQVATWYSWYFGALVNAHAWEIAAYRAAGYQGALQLVLPGTGASPFVYTVRIDSQLAPNADVDYFRTLNTGSVWWKLLDDLPDLEGVVVDISSVYDDSGIPRGNACTPSDPRVDYMTSAEPDSWSDTRWLTYLAHLHHLQVMGENPGNTPAGDLPGIMNLVRTCGLVALQWAFEPQLHDGSYANIDQYGSFIHGYRTEQRRP